MSDLAETPVATVARRRVRSHNDSAMKPALLAAPVVYFALFFVLPFAFLVALGFWSVENFQIVAGFRLDNYLDIFSQFFSRSNYGMAILQSVYVAATTAVLAVLFCYPMALAIVYAVSPRWQRMVLLFAVAPFWTSYILRVYAWQILLAKRGIINTALVALGLGDFQQSILYTQIATRIGLIHYLAPILIVILYVTVTNIDRTLIEAARELGATRWQALTRVILPLSRGGIVLSLSFGALVSCGDVLAGSLLGGGAGKSILGALPLYSNVVIREYASSTNLPRTSALAMILVILMVLMLLAGFAAGDRARRSVS